MYAYAILPTLLLHDNKMFIPTALASTIFFFLLQKT